MATKKKARPVEEDDDDGERPAKKKKKKKQSAGNAAVLYIAVGTVVALLVVAGGGTAAYFIFKRPANPPIAHAPQDADKKGAGEDKDNRTPARIVVPDIKEGNPANKGGIANNIRGAGYRTEREAEMRGMHQFYTAWSSDPGPKTLDSYLAYIQRDARGVHDAIKEGYYKVNVKAKGSDILAGENRASINGFSVIRANGQFDNVPEAEFRKALP